MFWEVVVLTSQLKICRPSACHQPRIMLSPPPVTTIVGLDAIECTQSGWLPDLAFRIPVESVAAKPAAAKTAKTTVRKCRKHILWFDPACPPPQLFTTRRGSSARGGTAPVVNVWGSLFVESGSKHVVRGASGLVLDVVFPTPINPAAVHSTKTHKPFAPFAPHMMIY